MMPSRDELDDGASVRHADVLVVGAGPAGALAACLAARAGASVILVERATFPRWKVCGACLNGAAGSVLREAGLGHVAEMGRPLERLTVRGWGRSVDLPVQGSVALTRRAMDTALLEAARQAGAEVIRGTALGLGTVDPGHPGDPGLSGGPDHSDDPGSSGDERRVVAIRSGGELGAVAARVVLDAAGLAGLRAGDGAEPPAVAPDARIGVGAVYPGDTPGWNDGVIHMVTGAPGYVGLVRTEDGTLNVAGALDPEFVRAAGGPEAAVQEHLAAAGVPVLAGAPVEAWRGTPALTRRPHALAGRRWLRVGDAAGYVEPFTGEGMAWALGGGAAVAPLLLDALAGWSPDLERRWAEAHRAQVGARQRLCRGVAWLSRRPALARAGLGLLRSVPWIAAPLTRHTAQPFPTRSSMPALTQGAAT